MTPRQLAALSSSHSIAERARGTASGDGPEVGTTADLMTLAMMRRT